jgi:chondroitin sulfate proteoglycan 4
MFKSLVTPHIVNDYCFSGLVALETEEGGTAIIREKNLNLSGIVQLISSYQGVLATQPPRLRLVLSQAPQHGFVSVSGRRVDLGSEMTAEEIASGQVEYQHDHSDTLEDWIGLTVLLQRPEKGSDRPDILLYNGTLRVNILPVNDQIFQLLTKAPAMTVVERQWRAITAEVLLTEDADTSAKDLIYDVIQAPQFGKLALTAENATTLAMAGTTIGPPLVRFSQDDVNRGRVVFLHDGTMDPRSTFFIFRVSDGHFKADSGVFSIHFEPLTLRFVNHSVIGIQQGQSTAIVVNSSMGAESNGQRRHIFYNVVSSAVNFFSSFIFLVKKLTVFFRFL